MTRLVFAAVFLAAVFLGAAADAQRWPPNGQIWPGPAGCLKLNNGADKGVFQTDIIEPAGADRVSVRFLAENRCQTAIRIMGGLRMDGRTIQQRGPIEIHAVRATGRLGESIGKGSLQSFVIPANGTVAVEGLVMLAAGAVPADVAVVIAARFGFGGIYDSAFVRGGTEQISVSLPPGTTIYCAHYEDRRCGDWQ